MIKPTVQIGDDKLRKRSKAVRVRDIATKEVQTIIRDLKDSMRSSNLVGMAAVQIGINLNIFVSEIRSTQVRKNMSPDPFRVFINPKIMGAKGSANMVEGCGSVAYGSLHGLVKRSQSLTLVAYNEHGELVTTKCEGLLAQIAQHEIDHLNGILCIDKFTSTKSIFYSEIIPTRSKKIPNND